MPSFVANLIRPRDLLDAQLEFVDLALDVSDPGRPRLRRTGAGQAVVVLRLPPQHIAEEVTGGSPTPRLPYQSRLCCPSRIAFKVPDIVGEIPFDAEAILALLSTWEPLVSEPAAAGEPTTRIEFPDRLLIVPEKAARLFHGTAPATSAETRRTAIWHSRIRTATNLAPRFRAVENNTDIEDRPFETTLKQRHRADIVERSTTSGEPHVIAASRFMLTALGASASLKSGWAADDSDLLQAWDHDAEAGRDLYVRTAEKGYLFPFGHRATLVRIIRRQFESHFPLTVAELVRKVTLVLQDEERDFIKIFRAYPSRGREMPLKLVRLAPGLRNLANERDPVTYPAIVTDAEGNEIPCNLTVLFVPASEAADPAALGRVREAYKAHQDVDLDHRAVTMAEDREARGDAVLSVKTLTLGARIGNELHERVHPAFLPQMESAAVRVPALEQLLATSPGEGLPPATTITLHPDYLRTGFTPGDRKRVYAKFAPVPGITIPAERAGGIAAPRFPDIDGLSKTMGPVSGVDRFSGGAPMTAEQLIGNAKLLGVIELKKIIGRVDAGADNFRLEEIEALYDRIDTDTQINLTRPMMTTVKRGDVMETRFLWKPKLEPGNFPPLLKSGGPGIELIIKGRITKSVASASAPPGFEVEGKLRHFSLEFASLMSLEFNELASETPIPPRRPLMSLEFNGLEFRSGAGRKLEVKIDLKAFRFLGDLRFVEEIRNLIPLKNLAGSPVVRPQPDGVVIGYSLPIPAIPLGIFNVMNIALVSSVSIPFVEGRPVAVRFSLSERSNPFLVSASIFGGTGFFAIEVRTDGLVRVEAAVEFGGLVALDLVIVKGGIYLLAGIYVAMDTDGQVLISGYLRFGGYVDVLGLISVSIEFYIALTYDGSRNVLFGEGRVTVSVKVLFFNESFGFTVRKEVPGFGQAPGEERRFVPATGPAVASASTIMASSPIFAAALAVPRAARVGPTMNMQQWQRYCAAFG